MSDCGDVFGEYSGSTVVGRKVSMRGRTSGAGSDCDLVEECQRLENLDEMSRCEEMRLEIVQDELDRRQL